ncbi:MAG: hypothetical protein OEZ29_06790 [Candidatus Bathyarchaeota archaeon]|nr:hypothetical protein [Candidatus Bathyarchaeota archaeon]
MDRSGRGEVLEKYETGCKYEEMAEALKGRSEAAIRNKLSKLRAKGEKREDLYIGGRGSAHTEKSPFCFLNFGEKINWINVQYI